MALKLAESASNLKHVLQRKSNIEMQAYNLQEWRLARKERLQFTIQIEGYYSYTVYQCEKRFQNKSYPQSSAHNWYTPLLSGYCWRKCLYRAVVVFFMKCRWCDLHFAWALQMYFFPPLGCWTYECIPTPLMCWKTKSFLLGLGIKLSLQWLFTSFKTIIPPCTAIMFCIEGWIATSMGSSDKNIIP